MAKTKPVLSEQSMTRKTFSYSLDGVNINFVLRVDVKRELKAGKEILERALKDFDKEIEKLS